MERHRAEFRALIERDVDVLFANEHEITMLYEVDDFDDAARHIAGHCEIAALTRGPKGSVVVGGGERHEIAADPVEQPRRHDRRRRPVRRRVPLRPDARTRPRGVRPAGVARPRRR